MKQPIPELKLSGSSANGLIYGQKYSVGTTSSILKVKYPNVISLFNIIRITHIGETLKISLIVAKHS